MKAAPATRDVVGYLRRILARVAISAETRAAALNRLRAIAADDATPADVKLAAVEALRAIGDDR
jgi:hypothetical protein